MGAAMNQDLLTELSRAHSRRKFLRGLAAGCSGIALQSLLAEESGWRAPDGKPHFPQKAQRGIWLFMRGGVSHMESFDPKPALNLYAGKTFAETPFKDVQSPEKLKNVRVVVVNDANGQQRNKLYPLQAGFKQYGRAGVEIRTSRTCNFSPRFLCKCK